LAGQEATNLRCREANKKVDSNTSNNSPLFFSPPFWAEFLLFGTKFGLFCFAKAYFVVVMRGY
jgi:hypothetical protein